MIKPMGISIRGKTREWFFILHEDDKYLEEWKRDGLDIDEVINTYPIWIKDLGLIKLWTWLQDMGLVNICI